MFARCFSRSRSAASTLHVALILTTAFMISSASATITFSRPPAPFDQTDLMCRSGPPFVTNSDIPSADCIAAAGNIIFGHDDPAGFVWYYSRYQPSSRVNPGQTIPQVWKHGRCQITLDWVDDYAAERGSTAQHPVDIKAIAERVSGVCIADLHRTEGKEPVGQSGLVVSVQTMADLDDPALVQILEQAWDQRYQPGWLQTQLEKMKAYRTYEAVRAYP